ncbi:MAG: hypothetical protein ACYDBJ_07930 [Aggregatilineales bacterium]
MGVWKSVGYFLRKLPSSVFANVRWQSLHVGLLVSLSLAALIGLPRVNSATAQTPPATQQVEVEQVVYGRPALGKIVDADSQHEWLFLPTAKDRITITVNRTSDTLVPSVALQDERGNVLAKADHDPTYARASIQNFTLPEPGRYIVVVGRYNGQTGKTFGGYRLVVSLLGLGEDGFNPTFVEGRIPLAQPRDGTISESKWLDTWAFQTQGTDPVTIIVSRVRGTLVPTVKLFDSNWKQVASGVLDKSFATVAIAKYVPTASSQYYVTISRVDGTNGGTTGDYRLTVVQGQQQ